MGEYCRRFLILQSCLIGRSYCGVGLCVVALVIKAVWASNHALGRSFCTHFMPVRIFPCLNDLKAATWCVNKPLADDTSLFTLRTEGGKETDLFCRVCHVEDAG